MFDFATLYWPSIQHRLPSLYPCSQAYDNYSTLQIVELNSGCSLKLHVIIDYHADNIGDESDLSL